MLLPTLRWLAVDYPQVVTFTSVNLYWLLGEVERHERRSCAESPRRAEPAGNLAPGPRHAALGRRDRRAGRHHPAGGLPAPAGPQGRRPGRRPPGRHPAPVPDPTRRPGIARPVPGRAVASRAPPAEGRRRVRHRRDRGGRGGGRRPVTTAAPYTASVHIDADPERVFDHFTRPEAILRWMGDYAALDPTPGGQFTLDLNGVPVRARGPPAPPGLAALPGAARHRRHRCQSRPRPLGRQVSRSESGHNALARIWPSTCSCARPGPAVGDDDENLGWPTGRHAKIRRGLAANPVGGAEVGDLLDAQHAGVERWADARGGAGAVGRDACFGGPGQAAVRGREPLTLGPVRVGVAMALPARGRSGRAG